MVKIVLQKTLMSSFTDDGLLEIIGQKEVWLAQKERIRLDQVTHHLKFVFRLLSFSLDFWVLFAIFKI